MRSTFSIVFLIMALSDGICAFLAWRSHRAIGKPLAALLTALIPPVIGNMIIISTGRYELAIVGCYVYYLGMDLVMLALSRFALTYCHVAHSGKTYLRVVYALLGVDAVQLLLNPFFGHAFQTEPIQVDGFAYYRLVPRLGQSFHRIVDYGILLTVIIILIYKVLHTPRVYAERYGVILLAMIAGGAWETYYIFSRTPVDRSMVGFCVFGLLAFYFSIFYKPVRLLDRMLANIASQLPEAMFFFDAHNRCVWANRPGRQLVEIREGDYDTTAQKLRDKFGVDLEDRSEWSLHRYVGEGEYRKHYVLEHHVLLDEQERMVGSFLSVRDNTEEHRTLQIEKYNAAHDRLTGLYNREHLYEKAREMIDNCPDEKFNVVFVDVKDFKIVNDIFGTAFGDYAIRAIGRWLADNMPEGSVYGRLAGDTFGVCLRRSDFDPAGLEEKLAHFVVSTGAMKHSILIHLGVYEVAEPELEMAVMFDRAHMALGTIAGEYQVHIAYYDEAMRGKVVWNQRISAELPRALTLGQVRPYLQPIVDKQGRALGAEALVRWQHPTEDFLSPAAFIPVFEENGMIAQVDRYMWRRSCEILADWQARGLDAFISVNISPKDFFFMDVAAEIRAAVDKYGVEPSRLRLEITESVMMADTDNRMKVLGALREDGFIIEMDDFGSGYSSLNLLKDMPVDVMKVDMAFLSDAANEMKARKILNNVIRLSDDIDILSLVEGVETAEQYSALAQMGCRMFQGYYFAKPMPVDEFESNWLAKNTETKPND